MPSGPAMCEKANALLVEMAEPGSQPATVKIKWVDRFKERHKLSKKRQAPPAGCSSTTGGDKRWVSGLVDGWKRGGDWHTSDFVLHGAQASKPRRARSYSGPQRCAGGPPTWQGRWRIRG